MSTSIEKPANTPLENEGTPISNFNGSQCYLESHTPELFQVLFQHESTLPTDTRCTLQADPNRRKLMVLQSLNMASFLSQLSDRLPLSSLLLPGKSTYRPSYLSSVVDLTSYQEPMVRSFRLSDGFMTEWPSMDGQSRNVKQPH